MGVAWQMVEMGDCCVDLWPILEQFGALRWAIGAVD